MQLSPVTDDIAAKIKDITDVNVRGFNVAIEARQIEHILKDHGENSLGDQSMADPVDIARIEYAHHSNLIQYIKEGKKNGQANRSTERISERLDRLQHFDERTDSSWGSNPYRSANSGNEPQAQRGSEQRSEDYGRISGSDHDGHDDGGSGVTVSPNDPTDSVGAALEWFDPNTRLQYEHGTIPDGENPVRPDDLPKKDLAGGDVSYKYKKSRLISAISRDFLAGVLFSCTFGIQ